MGQDGQQRTHILASSTLRKYRYSRLYVYHECNMNASAQRAAFANPKCRGKALLSRNTISVNAKPVWNPQ